MTERSRGADNSSFSDLHGRYRVENGKLVFRDEITWEIRSADDRIIDAVEQFLKQHVSLSVHGTDCDVESFSVSHRSFSDGAYLIKMDTPILAYETAQDGYVTYYAPDEARFSETVIRNLETKYCALYEKQPLAPIVFAPLRVDGKNKCVTRYKKTLLTAYYGMYRLEAPGDMVALAYHAGLGAKNSIGFGTIRRDIALEQSE